MNFNIRLFIRLVLAFIIFTIAGTLLHELGHYSVARALGWKASLHYGFAQPHDTTYSQEMHELLKDSIRTPERMNQLLKITEKERQKRFLFTLGGPVQTMLTGTIGLLCIVFSYRNYRQRENLSFTQWLCIFLSLFWLRESFNLAGQLFGYIRTGTLSFRDDESKLSLMLQWPQLSILLVTGMIGLSVLAFITFKVVPAQQRITFLAAGLVGGGIGFPLWLSWLGPVVMP